MLITQHIQAQLARMLARYNWSSENCRADKHSDVCESVEMIPELGLVDPETLKTIVRSHLALG